MFLQAFGSERSPNSQIKKQEKEGFAVPANFEAEKYIIISIQPDS